MKTIGEETFERYLDAHGIKYEYEKLPQDKKRPPDYTIQHDREYFLEVKDFNPTDIAPSGFYDGYARIREKIDRARKKFKEYEGEPCALVLYNNDAPLVHITAPDIVLGAMYGDAGVKIPLNVETGEASGEAYPAFLGGGKMIRPHWKEPENTRISALISLRYVNVGFLRLRKYVKDLNLSFSQIFGLTETELDFDSEEKQLGVIIWENAFAATPFPRDLFCGDYDEIYGVQDGSQPRIFAGGGILAYEELEASLKTPSFFDIIKRKSEARRTRR
jgi:hypothetical protein